MDEGDHRELVARLLAIRGAVALSGYYHPIYKPLEKARWERVDITVRAYSSDKRTPRTECLWLSPGILSRNDKTVLTPEEKMRAGAHHTHEVRVGNTTKRILRTMERLRATDKEQTMTAVAKIVGISREHLSRRYRHLFPV